MFHPCSGNARTSTPAGIIFMAYNDANSGVFMREND